MRRSLLGRIAARGATSNWVMGEVARREEERQRVERESGDTNERLEELNSVIQQLLRKVDQIGGQN